MKRMFLSLVLFVGFLAVSNDTNAAKNKLYWETLNKACKEIHKKFITSKKKIKETKAKGMEHAKNSCRQRCDKKPKNKQKKCKKRCSKIKHVKRISGYIKMMRGLKKKAKRHKKEYKKCKKKLKQQP